LAGETLVASRLSEEDAAELERDHQEERGS
jgi:hypothetical protein